VGRAAGVGGWPRQRRRTGVSVLHEFWVDLALRYFVSFLYNLNGFMEPLRTGIVRGGFLCLGHYRGEEADPSASLGMTIFLGMTVFCGDRVSRVMEFKN
jgi:hypothetical protein